MLNWALNSMHRFPARCAAFLGLVVLTLFLLWKPLRALASLALDDERYTYLLTVPLLSAGMIVLKRGRIFAFSEWDLKTGAVAALLASVAWLPGVSLAAGLGDVERLSLNGGAAALALISAFGFCFGRTAVKAAVFPLAFLLLIAPIPEFLMHKAEVALQHGSAEVTHVLMKMLGMPVFRDGLLFSLPGLNVLVAEECSGIRSSTMFWMTSAAASYLFLRSGWSRLALMLLTVPILIFKNAVRITMLSWLGVNVSQDVLHGDLHRQGGVPFGLIAIGLLVPALAGMRKLEDWTKRRRSLSASQQ